MDYPLRKLGTSDLMVPAICLGTMNWGQQNNEKEAHEQLNYAIEERGLHFLDTSEVYPVPPESTKQGTTEIYIGNWLHKRKKRDDLIIATKVSASPIIRTRDVGSKPRYDKKSIHDAIDGSLRRLKTNYIDLYQVHWPERQTNFFGTRGYSALADEETTAIAQTLETLTDLIKDGKIRYIGVSNETPWGLMEYLRVAQDKNLAKIVSIQNQYSLLNRTYEIGLSEISLKENIGMLVYSALNMGVLSGKYLDNAKPKDARFTLYNSNGNPQRYNPVHAQPAIKAYVELAKKHNLEPAQMALAFAISRPFVTSVILGATSVAQLKADMDSFELKLSQEVLTEIENIHLRMPDVTH